MTVDPAFSLLALLLLAGVLAAAAVAKLQGASRCSRAWSSNTRLLPPALVATLRLGAAGGRARGGARAFCCR